MEGTINRFREGKVESAPSPKELIAEYGDGGNTDIGDNSMTYITENWVTKFLVGTRSSIEITENNIQLMKKSKINFPATAVYKTSFKIQGSKVDASIVQSVRAKTIPPSLES